MNRKLVFSVLGILFLTACGAFSGPSPGRTRAAPHPFDIAWDDRAIFREGLVDAEQTVLDDLPGATVYHIDLQIPDDFRALQGREEIRYTNRENDTLDEVYFRLFSNTAGGLAVVSAVKVDGQDVEPIYEFQDSAVRLALPTPLQPGEHVDIQMDFAVEMPRVMGGNYGLFGYYEGILVLDGFYPVIPVYDDEGWNVEIPRRNGDVTYFDASFYLVRVSAPAGLTVVASGVEVGREYVLNSQVLTFAAGPARDFYLAASDDYMVVSGKAGKTTLNSYARAGQEDMARFALRVARKALKSFNKRFGVYPYTEFDIVSTPMMALGMEYPGMTAISLSFYGPAEQAQDRAVPSMLGGDSGVQIGDGRYEVQEVLPQGLLEDTVAHEVGHQWFYNLVGNDQVDEPWLDEAVVQYITGLYYLDTGGKLAAKRWFRALDRRWDRVGQADIPIGLSAGSYTGREYGAIVYGRGPLFIAALAEAMGQEAFDEFLRDYYESHKWGIGVGDTFREFAEDHCQCDLTALFDEWVYEK